MRTSLAAVLLALLAAPFLAQAQQPAQTPSVRMVRGFVVAVDPARRTLLLKHEEIISLGMPEMEMEYTLPDGAALPTLAAGDKVRFAVVRLDGHHVVTRVEPLPAVRRGDRRRSRRAAVRADR